MRRSALRLAPRALSQRELNRALLARQMLLERRRLTPPAAIERLVGMQAQEPADPYVGLWTRLRSFAPEDLAGLIMRGAAVRAPLMRGTIHLVTARDHTRLWPALREMLQKRLFTSTPYGKRLDGVDVGVFRRRVARLLTRPRTRAELRVLLHERWPGFDADALANAAQYLVPVVQAPPRGAWGKSGAARWALFPAPHRSAPAAALVLRYLAAFGPASAADVRAWSGLAGAREILDRVRPRLRTFRGPSGAELFDVPDGPLPDARTPAPPRFLPAYDNVLLAHADRSRMLPADGRIPWFPEMAPVGTLLVDGVLRATWRAERETARTTLRIGDDPSLSRRERRAVEAEGEALLAFLSPEVTVREVRFVEKVWAR